MAELMKRKVVRIYEAGEKPKLLPGRYSASVDRETGDVVLFTATQVEHSRMEGATISDHGKTTRVVSADGGTTWELGCGCGA